MQRLPIIVGLRTKIVTFLLHFCVINPTQAISESKNYAIAVTGLFLGTVLFCSPPSAFSFADDQCAGDRFGSDLVCTAGDVSITGIAVAPGTPTKCIGGTTFIADLDVTVNFSTPDRWDIGIFLANDGADPQTTTVNGGSSSCSVGILPTSFPFLDLDPNGGLDTCGDGNGSINGGAGNGVVRISDVPVQCQAIADSGGGLYIPFVVSWDNQSSPTGDDCTSIADPVPNTKSKCNAPDVTNPIEVLYGTVNAIVLPDISKTNGITAVNPGDSIAYDIIITNTTGQPLSGAVFTDPATANVNVGSVSCNSAGGATCPATTVAAMQSTGITIPDMPVGSSVTFTINATVSDPIVPSHASSISNTAYVTVQGEFNSATDSDTINGAVFSDLSTSTKDVVDLNGGEADPGDTLRYTITLNETEGNPVISATVTDDIPAGINNFTVVSIPTGAIDNSTGSGTGANGTGYLDITGIDVAASGSGTIEFDVTIPLGTPPGTLIDNTAAVSNPGGLGATPVAPTVPVSPSAVPTTDNKQLYLDSTTMSRAKPATVPAPITLTRNNPISWTTTPVLQIDNTIESTSATLFLSDSATQSQQVEVLMYCSSNPTAYATSGTYALGNIPATPTAYTFNLTTRVGGFSLPATCPAGDFWVLVVENQNNNDITLTPVTSTPEYSRLNLDSSNVIYVENILFYDAPYPGGNLVTSATPGSTIYIRSVISDPFGSFDITDAIIEITDPLETTMLTPPPVSMNVENSSGAFKTFEYPYTLPAAPAAGNWSVRVTGLEGDEGLVTDDLVGAFTVESLDLELTKTVDTATPTELGNVVYTLTVSNLDTVDTATGILITDLLPAGLTYDSDTASSTVPPTTYNSGTGVWDIGTLAPSTGISMTITAQTGFGTAGSTITNTATITANNQYDGNPTNNTASVDVTPVAAPSLTILKSADKAAVNSGEEITYTLVVQNSGAGVATNVAVYDILSPYVDMVLDFDTGTPPVEALNFTPQTSGLTLGAPVYTYSGPDIVRWDIIMGGSFAATSQFTLQFKVLVK